MRVLRRKRRQPELTTREAVSALLADTPTLATAPGVSEVTFLVRTSEAVIDSGALPGVFLWAYDVGTGSPRHEEGVSATSTAVASGTQVVVEFPFEADTGAPWSLFIPTRWQGVRSPAGASVGGIGQGIPVGIGLASVHNFV
jgi:hypothetical protein